MEELGVLEEEQELLEALHPFRATVQCYHHRSIVSLQKMPANITRAINFQSYEWHKGSKILTRMPMCETNTIHINGSRASYGIKPSGLPVQNVSF
jgi:hypothetical protein